MLLYSEMNSKFQRTKNWITLVLMTSEVDEALILHLKQILVGQNYEDALSVLNRSYDFFEYKKQELESKKAHTKALVLGKVSDFDVKIHDYVLYGNMQEECVKNQGILVELIDFIELSEELKVF